MGQTFEIRDGDFRLDGDPFKILSGAIHYFRIPPSDWEHSLYNLKALGFNTVETYVPWNVHEPTKGAFNFDGAYDIEGFIQTAEALGLYVIIRPSPYICAEWEFGGLPAWLLEEDCRIRSSDPKFLAHVKTYYQELFPHLVPYQITEGGPVLMMQIENEYGSYGEDKVYLESIKTLMRQNGVTVPLFTSDGGWDAVLRAGTLMDTDEDILATANFGSHAVENFASVKRLMAAHNRNWPLMCMEFWDGWFNRWGEPIVTRETDELVEAIREVLEVGSINLYMFHGGTNFGFYNGCSARHQTDLPQITSYDYGAPLDEQGNPTEKYFAIKALIADMFPEIEQMAPRVKKSLAKENIALVGVKSVFDALSEIGVKTIAKYPQTIEAMGHPYGYVLYRTALPKDSEEETIRLIDGRDRAQLYINQEFQAVQYQEAIGEKIPVTLTEAVNQLDVLVENMGRVNYGHKLVADTQRKGFRQGIIADLHFLLDWEQYAIDFNRIADVTYTSVKLNENTPQFLAYDVTLDTVADTYLDVSAFGKGVAFVNGHHLGRFWDRGPTLSLYVPKAYLAPGDNRIVIFETEGRYASQLNMLAKPKFKEMEVKKNDH